jgi:hypothetical protein
MIGVVNSDEWAEKSVTFYPLVSAAGADQPRSSVEWTIPEAT